MDSSMNDNQLVVPVIESNKKTNENIKIKKITENLILLCSKQSRYTNESIDKYFNRLTHLHMQSKKISLICQLELCPNLKVNLLYSLDYYILINNLMIYILIYRFYIYMIIVFKELKILKY